MEKPAAASTGVKVLVVSASFYPENSPRSFRTTELVKELARQGYAVTVYTHRDNRIHSGFGKKYGVVIRDLGQRRWKGWTRMRSGLLQYVDRALVRLPKLLLEFPDIELFWLVKRALRDESGFDLMISIAIPYPVHWGIAALRSPSRPIAGKWIADCGDPYTGRENDTFRVPFYFGFIEKWFMRKTDFVTVPTDGAVDAYFPEFRPKIRVIPQGVRFQDFELIQSRVKNVRPTFAYAGIFIPGRRDPGEFLDILEQQEIDFEFHIFTGTPGLVRERASAIAPRIILHEPVPRAELFRFLGIMDFLVNFENAGTRQTPSKLIDFLVLKKPVLSIRTGALDERVVLEFLRGDYSGQMVIENPDQYRIENVCDKFMQLLK